MQNNYIAKPLHGMMCSRLPRDLTVYAVMLYYLWKRWPGKGDPESALAPTDHNPCAKRVPRATRRLYKLHEASHEDWMTRESESVVGK
jgi:hypothetical protein